MNRPVSPLLHDYKPSAAKKPAKSKAVQWFAVGLGLPLIGLALISGLNSYEPKPLAPETPAMTGTSTVATPFVEQTGIEDAELAPQEAVTLAPPEPEFDKLVLKVGRGDTMERLFRKNKLNLGNLMAIARLDAAKYRFRKIKPGDIFEVTHDDGQLVSMYSELDLTTALSIEKQGSEFVARVVERPVEFRKRHAYGVITTSLFESAEQAGLSDKIIMNVAGIFAWDVDFVLDIRSGDNYYLQYEEIWQDGKFITNGEIVAAEFNNNGRTIRAIRFKDDDNQTNYFTPTGDSVRKAFLRNPVDFTRISSNFNPSRRHPILNTIRAHRGVDYAAPRGTPIKASGDGKVIFRGTKSGYGKAIILQHGGNITTLYAHMSGYASKARLGSRVRQGQTIGYVGSTGLATANHLHYEYRLNGAHRNPRTIALPDAAPIAAKYRDRFLTSAKPIIQELEAFKSTQVASIGYSSQ